VTASLVGAAALAGGAALLAVAPGAGRLPRRPGPVTARRRALWSAGAAALVGAVVLLLDGTGLALGLIVLGAGGGVLRLWRRARARAEAEQRRRAVIDLGEGLVGELRAGLPPVTALQRGAEQWPPFGPVAAAARLGADVPEALRRLASVPGGEDLRTLAAAWQVSEQSGAALAATLGQVVESARERRTAAQLVHSELASAQATARLVALLPVATLAMAAGVGADPWHFLLERPAGLACLAAGLALVLAGLEWIDRIAAAVTRT
jgi:tight adherence protein B